MRQRVEALVPGNRVWVSTFHSLGARLLRQYAERLGLDRNFTIYDKDDRNKVVKEALDAAGIDNVRFTPDRIGGAISKAKNQLLTPEQLRSRRRTTSSRRRSPRSTPSTRRSCATRTRWTSTTCCYVPALALKHDEELRAELDARFRFVLIDEYQDTNEAQYEIARRLSVDHPNLCVVGDPDQIDLQVARLRHPQHPRLRARLPGRPRHHARPELPQHEGDPRARPSALIAHNKQRKKKTLVTENPDGEPVRVLTFDTGLDEAERRRPADQGGASRPASAATATSPSSCASTP